MGERRSRSTHVLAVALTNLIALGCLAWTLRDAHLGELKDDLAQIDWGWVAVAVIADVVVYFWHGLRWSVLLRPVVRVRYLDAVRSIYVGLFANEILPLRAGELLRCYLLGRLSRLPISVSVASAAIERVFDGLWLCGFLVLTLHFVPIPKQLHFLVDGAYLLSMVVLVGAVVVGWGLFQRHTNRAARVPGEGWRRQLAALTDYLRLTGRSRYLVFAFFRSLSYLRYQLAVLMDDLGLMGHSRYLVFAFFQSLPYLLLQVIPIWATFRSYGFDLSIGAAFALMVLLRLGSAVPQAPGNLGLFQFLTKECLEHIFNVVPDEAARFSLVLWGVVTIPLMIAGFIAADFTGTHLGDLKQAAQQEVRESRARDEARQDYGSL